MQFLRDYAASYIRTLRRNLHFERGDNSRMRDMLALQQDTLSGVMQERDDAKTESRRLSTLLDAERIRVRELEVDKAILKSENDLLALVVQRQHDRVKAEIAIHAKTIEGEDLANA